MKKSKNMLLSFFNQNKMPSIKKKFLWFLWYLCDLWEFEDFIYDFLKILSAATQPTKNFAKFAPSQFSISNFHF